MAMWTDACHHAKPDTYKVWAATSWLYHRFAARCVANCWRHQLRTSPRRHHRSPLSVAIAGSGRAPEASRACRSRLVYFATFEKSVLAELGEEAVLLSCTKALVAWPTRARAGGGLGVGSLYQRPKILENPDPPRRQGDDGYMWLELEKGTARHLRRLLHIDVGALDPARPSRRALMFEAAHTVLPEAGVENLPGVSVALMAASASLSRRIGRSVDCMVDRQRVADAVLSERRFTVRGECPVVVGQVPHQVSVTAASGRAGLLELFAQDRRDPHMRRIGDRCPPGPDPGMFGDDTPVRADPHPVQIGEHVHHPPERS